MLLAPGQVLSSHSNLEDGHVPYAGRWRLRGIAGSFDYRESVSTTWAPDLASYEQCSPYCFLSPSHRKMLLSRL